MWECPEKSQEYEVSDTKSGAAVTYTIGSAVSGLVHLINLVVIIYCLLTWFPNIRWYDQPWRTLDQIVRPILAPFRKIIPPIGNIDISPMVAMAVLYAIEMAIQNFLP